MQQCSPSRCESLSDHLPGQEEGGLLARNRTKSGLLLCHDLKAGRPVQSLLTGSFKALRHVHQSSFLPPSPSQACANSERTDSNSGLNCLGKGQLVVKIPAHDSSSAAKQAVMLAISEV